MKASERLLERLDLRGIPYSREAELSVLGAMMLDKTALARAIELLEPEAFYLEPHREIYSAIVSLFEQNSAVDPVTLSDELKSRGQLDAVGGLAYVGEIVEAVPTAANIEYHARIVLEKGILRRLIEAATEIITEASSGQQDLEEALDKAEQMIFSLSDRRLRPGFLPIRGFLQEAIAQIEVLREKGERVTGLPSGFEELDRKTTGFHSGEFVVVAGRPGMGKTSLCLNVCRHVAITRRLPVALFSLEMSKEQVALRLLASEAEVDSNKLRTGSLNDPEMKRITHAAGTLYDAAIYIDDSPALNVLEMRAKARRLKSESDLGMVIVDYLQLMEGPRSAENRQQEIAMISRSLKALAKELHVPVVALSQLSRGPERRERNRPTLADLRECVTGDTLVVLADGRRVPIRELIGTTPKVLAVTPEGTIVPASSDGVWPVGRRPVFDVKLASGRCIRATDGHRLYGAGAWVRVCDLAVGDRLAIARRLAEPEEPEEWPDEQVALLGQLMGDGSYLHGQPLRYTTSSEENSRLVQEAARSEFGAVVRRYPGRRSWHQLLISGNGSRWRPEGLNAWLRELGIFGQRAHEKRVPGAVFRLSNRQVALLLKHLWATDGCIWTAKPRPNRSQRGRIYYATTSAGLASDVAALLLRLGIIARIKRVRQGGYKASNQIEVSGADQQRRFLQMVGSFGPRVDQAKRLVEVLGTAASNTNVDTLPREVFGRVRELMATKGISHRRMTALRGTSYGGSSHFRFAPSRAVAAEYAEILGDETLRLAAESDLFWDRVVAIERGPEEEVFDLTVPGPACWLADGIVSHNSGAIEQDADVVVFLYRDELYNLNSPDRGIAEVIIGKNRNGPTGEVRLKFIPEITSFQSITGSPF